MSIQGAERGVKAIAAEVIDKLPAVLLDIDAEKRDFVLPKFEPVDVVTYRLRERGTHRRPVRIEVYEQDATEFEAPETDLGEMRATYDLNVLVRSTIYNSSGLDESQMWDARRRYQAGVVRVFREVYEFPNGDVAITLVLPIAFSASPDTEDEGVDGQTAINALRLSITECPT